jgi:phosphoribosylcarboxyaminoimidazole (NCAIR) mutase
MPVAVSVGIGLSTPQQSLLCCMFTHTLQLHEYTSQAALQHTQATITRAGPANHHPPHTCTCAQLLAVVCVPCAQMLDNIFEPLFEVTRDPASHPQLHVLLSQVRQ